MSGPLPVVTQILGTPTGGVRRGEVPLKITVKQEAALLAIEEIPEGVKEDREPVRTSMGSLKSVRAARISDRETGSENGKSRKGRNGNMHDRNLKTGSKGNGEVGERNGMNGNGMRKSADSRNMINGNSRNSRNGRDVDGKKSGNAGTG